LKVTIDGQPRDIGGGEGKWPISAEILNAFIAARDICFPRKTESDEWAQRRVSVVTYAVDVVGKEPLSEGLTAENFDLKNFTDRAEVKQITEGKGNNKKTFNALILTGEWPEEDQQALMEKNSEKKDGNDDEEIDNPAHEVVKKALKKWSDSWKKLQKKMAGTEEGGDSE